MGLPDFQLILQAVLYLAAVGTGLVVSIPTALTNVRILSISSFFAATKAPIGG